MARPTDALPDLALRGQIRDLALRVAALELHVFGPVPAAEQVRSGSDEAPARDRAGGSNEPLPTPVRLDALTSLRESAPRVAPSPKSSPTSFDLERLIGGKTFAVLGALAVVVAAGLFLKLAYDQGWLGRIPDVWKCGLSALFGGALLALGEVALRRWGRAASIGLTSTGLGVVYMSAYAAYGMYNLASGPVAFAMLAGVAATGFALSARARRLPVALLATIAGYAIPLLLREADGPAFILPAHLLTMLAVALALCGALGHAFAPVRSLAWWATLLLGSIWTLASVHDHPYLTMSFVVAFWTLVHAELFWSCRRDDRALGDAARLDVEELNARPVAGMMGPLMRPLLGSFSQTAWATLFAGVVLEHGLDLDIWYAPAGFFAATFLAWVALAGGLRVLRDAPSTRLEALGASLGAQAGGLLVIAGALALSGFGETVAGIALGVSALFAARWLGVRALAAYGYVVLALATARLLAFDFYLVAMNPGYGALLPFWRTHQVWEVLLTRWTLLAALGALGWILAATLAPTRRGEHGAYPSSARTVSVVIAAALLALGFLSSDASAVGLFAAWLGCGLVMTFAFRPFGTTLAAAVGAAVTALAALAAIDAWPPHAWSARSAAPLTHPGFLAMLGLVAVFFVTRAAAGRAGAAAAIVRIAAGGVALALAFVATSAEAARVASMAFDDRTAKDATLTVWWAVFATAIIIAGFVRTTPVVRHVGLGLLCVAAGKAAIYDLAEVEPAWRIASFLGVGLFMLGVATGYTRIARHARTPDDNANPSAA